MVLVKTVQNSKERLDSSKNNASRMIVKKERNLLKMVHANNVLIIHDNKAQKENNVLLMYVLPLKEF